MFLLHFKKFQSGKTWREKEKLTVPILHDIHLVRGTGISICFCLLLLWYIPSTCKQHYLNSQEVFLNVYTTRCWLNTWLLLDSSIKSTLHYPWSTELVKAILSGKTTLNGLRVPTEEPIHKSITLQKIIGRRENRINMAKHIFLQPLSSNRTGCPEFGTYKGKIKQDCIPQDYIVYVKVYQTLKTAANTSHLLSHQKSIKLKCSEPRYFFIQYLLRKCNLLDV